MSRLKKPQQQPELILGQKEAHKEMCIFPPNKMRALIVLQQSLLPTMMSPSILLPLHQHLLFLESVIFAELLLKPESPPFTFTRKMTIQK